MARLLFFGNLCDAAGGREREFSLPADVEDLTGLLAKISAGDKMLGMALKETPLRFVVNQKVVEPDTPITDSDEIGFLPPFSGG